MIDTQELIESAATLRTKHVRTQTELDKALKNAAGAFGRGTTGRAIQKRMRELGDALVSAYQSGSVPA